MSRPSRTRKGRGCFLAALLACLTQPSPAVQPPQEGAAGAAPGLAAAKLRAAPALSIYQPGSKAAADLPRLAGFFAAYSDRWEVRWDLVGDRPHLLQGPGIPLPAAGGGKAGLRRPPAGGMRLSEVERSLRKFIARWGDLFAVSSRELRLDERRSLAFGADRYLWSVELQQFHRGLPVEGAGVFFRINHGKVVQFGSRRLAPVDLDTEPAVPRSAAVELAREALGGEAESLVRGRLAIFPTTGEEGGPGDGYHHRLAWELTLRPAADAHAYRVRVDAHSGELLEITDLVRSDAARVSGDVYPLTNADPPENLGFAHAAVLNPGIEVTDGGGLYDYGGGPATLKLDGRYVRIEDACGGISLTSDDGALDLAGGPGGTDCATPGFGGGGNTWAARTAFHHLSRMNRRAAAHLPDVDWLDGTLTARTNLPGNSCNASWDGAAGTVNFHRSGVGCSNTGELASILAHEWGHAVDANVGGEAEDQASGEALADTFAFLETGEACIGTNLRPGEACHNCRRSCTGARDVSAFAWDGAGALARPESVTDDGGLDCDRFACPYVTPHGVPYQGPMGYQAHCESLIASSANWDLYQLLVADLGPALGRQEMERLWYGSLAAAGSAYRRLPGAGPCAPGPGVVDGCAAESWYTVYLAVDDDDGDLSNGTPNACRIWEAFDAHGIACGGRLGCSCTRSPVADAGPDRQICAGEEVEIGSAALSDHVYSWSPGEATRARITVAPAQTTVYELAVSNACGEASDQVVVAVDAGCSPDPPGGTFGGFEDFEEGTGGWTASGLWHLSAGSSCGEPGYSSPYHAMYYGRSQSCDYSTGAATAGDLISPEIQGIAGDSYLSFDYLRGVESGDGGWDRAELAVSAAGGPWEPRWARDARHPSAGAWTSSGPISLAPYAGQSIRLRFRFDSLDASYNQHTGWMIDDVVVASGFSSPDNSPPEVAIKAPLEGRSADECQCVPCDGRAVDAEDGDLTSIVYWHSSIDGDLGAGDTFSTVLSPGVHTLTATATDSGGLTGSAVVTVFVTESPDGPCALAWPPAEPRRYCGED